jgi:hypothetical protein
MLSASAKRQDSVIDEGGEGVEHVESGQHHPAFKDAPNIDELRHRKFRHLVPKRASSRSISLTSLRAVSSESLRDRAMR